VEQLQALKAELVDFHGEWRCDASRATCRVECRAVLAQHSEIDSNQHAKQASSVTRPRQHAAAAGARGWATVSGLLQMLQLTPGKPPDAGYMHSKAASSREAAAGVRRRAVGVACGFGCKAIASLACGS
jgi:hypothetical protein